MFVVCGKNVALGVFGRMSDALASINQADSGAVVLKESDTYAEVYARDELLTVVRLMQAVPFRGTAQLFRY